MLVWSGFSGLFLGVLRILTGFVGNQAQFDRFHARVDCALLNSASPVVDY